MQVIATAGHVDHGKSALVRALTGMEPDRWAEERRRGMTIDLGFAWMSLPSGETLSFVDVPGHERFVTNMLAGAGPVPAVCLVVAADEGWSAQTEEHVRALDALGVAHGVLVVTKTDRADPGPVVADVRRRLAPTGLRDLEDVAVSAATGDGMPDVVAALDRLVGSLPAASAAAPVRLWIDRAFTIQGAGTVVTGTLAAGSIATGDTLLLAGALVGGAAPTDVVVRGLQTHRRSCDRATAVDRVALNLRGVARSEVCRGMALVTPGAWTLTAEIDARLDGSVAGDVVAHIGSAAVPVRLRPLAAGFARLRLAHVLPLHVGDRLILRDPGSRRMTGATVVDVAPAELRRRGDGARVAAALTWPRSLADEVGRLGIVRRDALAAAGFGADPDRYDVVPAGEFLVSRAWLGRQVGAAEDVVRAHRPAGTTTAELAEQTGVPADALTVVLANAPGIEFRAGRVVLAGDGDSEFSPQLRDFLGRLDAEPWAGLAGGDVDPAELSRAVRAGKALRLAPGLYVAADAPARAVTILSELPQPFTVSAARQALGSTRRVVVPLLEHLDATRQTRRDGDGNRVVTGTGA
jgi:selenocysteine-specific elongation factor